MKQNKIGNIMSNLFHEDLEFIFSKVLPFENISRVKGEDIDLKQEYLLTLKTVGDFCKDKIAPRAEGVDHKGCILKNGEVEFPEEVKQSFIEMKELGFFCGVTLPEKYGGFDFPYSVFFAMGEIYSVADSSLGLTPMLQDGVAQVLSEFADESINEDYIPKLIKGERFCSMGLTEPSAGSDLFNMKCKAIKTTDKIYHLTGTKIFITNGFGDVLALAKTEEGISMFLVKEKDKKVSRVESKLGIKGSATCEIVFDDSPGVLIGELGQGLIPNMHKLMNIARLGVAVQGLGIAQRAHYEAVNYASDRVQFSVPICEHGPVRQILFENEIELQASRALTYLATYYFDMREALKVKLSLPPKGSDDFNRLKKEYTKHSRVAEILIPLVKYDASELCNKLAYSAQQVFGGYGFTKEFPIERLYRDARITSIYEGTSQIQLGQVFNEAYYFEKIGLLNQYKIGKEHEFIETSMNKLFLDVIFDEYFSDLKSKIDEGSDLYILLNKTIKMKKSLKNVREFLFKQEKTRQKNIIKKYHSLFHKQYSDLIGNIFKSICLLSQACLKNSKETSAKAFINRAIINNKNIENTVFGSIDDVLTDDYDKVMG